MFYKLFTSESVCAGHPDKICDQISDSILDAAIASDPNAHSGIETLVTTNHVTVAGEVKVKNGVVIDYEKIVRDLIKELGYTNPKYGFDEKAKIETKSKKVILSIPKTLEQSKKCIDEIKSCKNKLYNIEFKNDEINIFYKKKKLNDNNLIGKENLLLSLFIKKYNDNFESKYIPKSFK